MSRCFQAFNLSLEPSDYCYYQPANKNFEEKEAAYEHNNQEKSQNRQDWNKSPDTSIFFGRAAELATLKSWICLDSCRLVGLFGMGGIGKTSLAAKLVEEIQGQFEFVIWRSLSHAPTLLKLLKELMQFFSEQTKTDLPETLEGQISQLIYYLRTSHCLLVLDNFEKILRSGETSNQSRNCLAGIYHQGHEDYGQLLKRLGEERHRSCLLLTSREKPKEISFQGLCVRINVCHVYRRHKQVI